MRQNPKLIRVDLTKADGCEHPGISSRKTYLVKVHGAYAAGKFDHQWYGWNFGNWGTLGIPLNAITSVWEISRRV